jgi:hypothetical protein
VLWLVVSLGGVAVLVCGAWLLLEPVDSAAGLFVVAEAPAADPAAMLPDEAPVSAVGVVVVPVLPAACWLVQESEIMFTELTWNEPSLLWLPWICTS